jgi:hypothetical protein
MLIVNFIKKTKFNFYLLFYFYETENKDLLILFNERSFFLNDEMADCQIELPYSIEKSDVSRLLCYSLDLHAPLAVKKDDNNCTNRCSCH